MSDDHQELKGKNRVLKVLAVAALLVLVTFLSIGLLDAPGAESFPSGKQTTYSHEGEYLASADLPSTLLRMTSSSADGESPGVRRSRLQLIWGLIGTLWGWLVLAVLLFSGLSPRLRDLSARLTGNRLGHLLPYIVLLSVLLALLALPISYYRGFVIEHEFGLSNQTFWEWLVDAGKGFGLSLISSLIMFSLVYLFIRRSPRRWWLYSAGLVIVFSVVIATIFPVVIAPIFNKYEPLQDEGLRQKILSLSRSGGVEVADVLQMDMSRQTKAANAYFAGIGPTTRIVLADTLLANFTEGEILTVVAHEMGHQVHNDLWRGIGVGVIFFLVSFYSLYRAAGALLARFGPRFGFRQLVDAASLPLLLLLLSLISFLAMPAENSFSRYIEHEADVYALELTRMNEDYASALQKLAEVNVTDPDPPGWIEFIFYSHPSLKKRIEFARNYQGQASDRAGPFVFRGF